MSRRSVLAFALGTAFLAAMAPAEAAHVSCGETLTTDTILDSDLVCTTVSGLVVAGDDVTVDLDGHSIESGGGSARLGVFITASSDRSLIRNGQVTGFRDGVALEGSDGVVEEMTLDGNDFGISIGVLTERATVERNRFEGGFQGISIFSDDPSLGHHAVRQNVFLGDGTAAGVSMVSTTGNVVEDNEMSGVLEGVAGLGVVGSRIEGNQIQITDGGSWGVIVLGDANVSDNVVVRNTIEGSPKAGIRHEVFGSGDRIAENSITGSEVGIWSEATATGMLIEDNVIDDATELGIQVTFSDIGAPAQHLAIKGNRVTGSGDDGILAEENPAQLTLESNLVRGSADDGIEARPSGSSEAPATPAIITANSTWENGDWGIIAASPASDGGANRAWSNGQPGQCLNIVCGPGPPASLALTPESATNPVGDEHCVTATVTDPDGRATPGETVRFSVNDDGTASETTGAGGTATFCYEGPLSPRTDEVAAFADTDGNGSQGTDEPGDTAAKSWVVPPSGERCRVKAGGTIVTVGGDAASFRINVQVHRQRSRGSIFYEDEGPADPVVLRTARISSAVCVGSSASIFGRTHGSSPVFFRIDVTDGGPGGDRLRFRDSEGHDSGPDRALTSGNILVH